MTDQKPVADEEVLSELETLCRAEVLPAKLQNSAQSLLDKLRAPVRIGIVGLPSAHKRRLLDALTGTAISRAAPELPPLEVSYGERTETTAILADGATLDSSGVLPRDLMEEDPVFLSIRAPYKTLIGREFLLVACEAHEADMTAALNWAASRVDMVLWCSRAWTTFEAEVWRGASDLLRNHALFIGTDYGPPPVAKMDLIAAGFGTAFHIPRGEDAKGIARFSTHLNEVISEGQVEDRLAAQVFLQRQAKALEAAHEKLATEKGKAPEDTVVPYSEVRANREKTKQIRTVPASSPAGIALARQFQFLRSAAEDLRTKLQIETFNEECVDSALSAIEATFETLADRVEAADVIQETWPDLAQTIADARDVSVLMRVEGQPEQLADAARLMVQVRQEMEHRLAA